MQIRQYFHSEEDLAHKMGEDFVRRWKMLLERYTKYIDTMRVNIMKVASLSFAFYSAAVDGNAELVHHFDDALHGYTKDVILLGDAPVRMYDDECINLVWDTAALMLEEDDELPRYAQYAYDEVGLHTKYAYKLPLVEKVVSATKHNEVKINYITNTTIPKVKQEEDNVELTLTLSEIIDYAENLPPEQMGLAEAVKVVLYDMVGSRCTPKMYERIKNIPQKVSAKRYLNAGQINLLVEQMISNGNLIVGQGDVNIKNYKEK